MLHFSSFAQTVPYVALSLLLYFMCGYLILNRILRTNLRKAYGTWVSLPVYLSAGIVFYTFILYVIGLIVFTAPVVTLLVIVISLLFLGDILFSARGSVTMTIKVALNKVRKIRLKEVPSFVAKAFPSIIAMIVLLVSILYITNVIATFEWPPAGDAIDHGMFTSLIIYDQRIPALFTYPLGFHANAALLALLLGIYPGESVFLFGGILMIALVTLTFALTYIITRSGVLALSTYALLYLTYSAGAGGGNLQEWLFGYFFNGPYPNIVGFLIVLLSVTAVVIQAKTKDSYVLLRFFPIMIIVLLLAYPDFVFVSLLAFVFAVFQNGLINTIKSCFRTRRDILATCFLAIFAIFFVLYGYFWVLTTHKLSSGAISVYYSVPQEYLLGSVFGVSIILALIFSCLLIGLSFVKAIRGSDLSRTEELIELRPLFLTYVLIALTLFLSLNPWFYVFLQYLLPTRLVIAVMILSLVLNAYTLSVTFDILTKGLFRFVVVEKRFGTLAIENLQRSTAMARIRRFAFVRKLRGSNATQRVCKSAPEKSLPVARNVAVALIVLSLFSTNGILAYSLSSHASYDLAHNWAWYSHSSSFQDDFKGWEWIDKNVSGKEFILTDWSYSSRYLMSLSYKNTSYYYGELQEVWLNPLNSTLVLSLITKYNVSYVFSASDWGYYSLTDRRYEAKPYSTLSYLHIFSSYDFLELVFISGTTAVFRTK